MMACKQSLRTAIKSKNLKLHHRILIPYGIARGMKFCYSKGIAHRDLKPDNILLDEAGYPYIGDFGTAKRQVYTGQSEAAGTTKYRIPGTMSDHTIESLPLDLYAYGLTALEVILNKELSMPINVKNFPHWVQSAQEACGQLMSTPDQGGHLAKALNLALRYEPTTDFSTIVTEWESVFPCLNEATAELVRAYREMLDTFEAQNTPEGVGEIGEFLNQLDRCDEVADHIASGPRLANSLDYLVAVLAYTAKDDECDNLALIEALWACLDEHGCLDRTEIMSRDLRVRAGFGGHDAIVRYACHLMSQGISAVQEHGCEVLRIVGETLGSKVAFYTLGEWYRHRSENEKALEYFTRCEQVSQTEIDAFLACADICYRTKRFSDARRHLEQALQIPNLTRKEQDEVVALLTEVDAVQHEVTPPGH
jgi:tetratricopeptide (TPR) repeat protein